MACLVSAIRPSVSAHLGNKLDELCECQFTSRLRYTWRSGIVPSCVQVRGPCLKAGRLVGWLTGSIDQSYDP